MYPGDELHDRANAVAASLVSTSIVTTQIVLAETLTFMADTRSVRSIDCFRPL